MNENNFLKEKINVINEIKEILIKAFIIYYGNSHTEHITKTINELNFVITSGNKFVGATKELTENELNIINNKLEQLDPISSHVFCYTQFIPPMINLDTSILNENSVDLHRIIHEINHTLHAFSEDINLDGHSDILRSIMKSYKNNLNIGINPEVKGIELPYEIFNDYMTSDVIQIVKVISEKNPKYNNLKKKLDFNFKNNPYFSIDYILNDFIKNIFNINKEKIKENLINHTPKLIFNYINEYYYIFICEVLNMLYDAYMSFYDEYCKKNNYEEINETSIINEFIQKNEETIKIIKEKLKNYFDNDDIGPRTK